MTTLIPVILSGGAGTRLWPLSREMRPKQLLPLMSQRSLLQETALRMTERPIVVCNQEHRFIVAEQLREIGQEPRAIIIEPVGRNTAPAVAVSALLTQAETDALLLVMPSDHRIQNVQAFRDAVNKAVPLALAGKLVTFGIQPSEANTGYGYIRRGAPIDQCFVVERFFEKPDMKTAQGYVESGSYLWNSGIFLFSPRTYLKALSEQRPHMVALIQQSLDQGETDLFFFRLAEPPFAAITGESIDYAVMEGTTNAAVVPVDMGWSDIGSWAALWGESNPDGDGNVSLGDVITTGTTNSYIRSEHQLVTTIGVDNLIVIATDDAVLVADKNHDQDVKKVVEHLKAKNRQEAIQGSRVWRPWGWFQTIDDGERYRVKHIQVNPGSKLSLQKHWHRSEHWVVVTGTALVTSGDKTFTLRENESTFIPAGTLHRLENPGKLPLRMIEVQSGEYVGEDDIVRIEDDYGRSS